MNAELDGTVGPILKRYADEAGVISDTRRRSARRADEPVPFREGHRPAPCSAAISRACRIPTATRRPRQASPSSGARTRTWSRPSPTARRSPSSRRSSPTQPACGSRSAGCSARPSGGTPIDEVVGRVRRRSTLRGPGIVDYVVGAKPGPGVFVFGAHDDPKQQHYLNLYKLGEGPLYSFYTPYHLCHFEVPNSVARAVLFGDAVLAPLGGPLVDVVTTAKTDLERRRHDRRAGRLHDLRAAENADVVAAATCCRWAWPRDASSGRRGSRCGPHLS